MKAHRYFSAPYFEICLKFCNINLQHKFAHTTTSELSLRPSPMVEKNDEFLGREGKNGSIMGKTLQLLTLTNTWAFFLPLE